MSEALTQREDASACSAMAICWITTLNMLALGGLNKTKMLIKVVKNRMKDCGIREEVREEPNTDGPLVFWSDLFFRCFIKQEENSVWILSGGGCGGASR
jgi:hypothetical protein